MSTPRLSHDITDTQAQPERHDDFTAQLELAMTERSKRSSCEGRDAYYTNPNDLALQESGHPSPSPEPTSEKPLMPPYRAWRTLFAQDIAKDWVLEAQLMLLTVATGIQDATTFTTYQVFTTKQTGNTLFLALYALNHPLLGPRAEQSVAVSIGAFVLGGAFFGHVARHVRQRRRAWLLMTNLFQTLLILSATALRYWGPKVKVGGPALGVVALLSFASSGQIAMALGVDLAEVNTTMITGSLVQLSRDPKLFHLHNPARNRRLVFYLSLLSGCFVGAATHWRDATLGLLLTAAVKAVVTVSFLFNRGVMRLPHMKHEKNDEAYATGTATPVSKILWGD